MPRTTSPRSALARRNQPNALTRASAIARARGSDNSGPQAASISVSARPPSGPCGYCPTSSVGQYWASTSSMAASAVIARIDVRTDEHDAERSRQVHRGGQAEGRVRPVSLVLDLAGLVGQLDHADRHGHAGVLEQQQG